MHLLSLIYFVKEPTTWSGNDGQPRNLVSKARETGLTENQLVSSKGDIATKLRKVYVLKITSSRQRKLFASRKWLWKINKLNDRTINNYSAPGFIAKHCDLSVSVTDKLFIYLLKGFMSCSRNVINNEKYWSRVKISWKNKYLDVITTSSLDLPTSQVAN